MQFKPKLWLGIGVVALASSAASNAIAFDQSPARQDPASNGGATALAQARGADGEGGEGGEGGERGAKRTAKPAKRGSGGEGGERRSRRGSGGEGGERGERGPRRGSGGEGGEGGERGRRDKRSQGGEGGEGGVNTRYIFGFTEGADTERKGEFEIENDTIARFEKRRGSYSAIQNKTEIEYGITNDLMVAVAGFAQSHHIRDVPGLDNVGQTVFDGVAGEIKYRFLDRRYAPFGFAISAEPEVRLHSETSGGRENAYAVELKAYADKELVPNRVFIAGTLLYEPEAVRAKEFDPITGVPQVIWEHESTFGISGAIAAAIIPSVFVGAEVQHLRKFEGMGLNHFEGEATFVGPTFSMRLGPHVLVQAAYSVQVAGHAVDQPRLSLDLANFERQKGRLRVVYEF